MVGNPRFWAYTAGAEAAAVFEVFEKTTPLVEGISIDEAFLDVGGLRRVAGTPVEIAVRLRRRVLDEVGLNITVGIACTGVLAKRELRGQTGWIDWRTRRAQNWNSFAHWPSKGSGASAK